MSAAVKAAFKRVKIIACGSLFIYAAMANSRSAESPEAAVKQAFARLATITSCRIETKGSVDGAKIDSRIDAQFPDHFHILNRGANASELILMPDGSFAKTDATSPWRAVPMSYLSIAESLGPKANENMLKTMRNVVFKGPQKCQGTNEPAKQYQFETDSDNNTKTPMQTTITIADKSGLPCRIRAQQSAAGIDTTAIYDYTSKFSISLPK